jgi:hypothetical protein
MRTSEYFEWHGRMLRNHTLWFRSGEKEEEIHLYPTDLLIAIDETGIEDVSDHNFPLFGLGGCGVHAGQFFDLMANPWNRLKQDHFSGILAPLHAADLRAATAEQMQAVGDFFQKHPFFRFAALLTRETNLHSPEERYAAVAQVLIQQIAAAGRLAPFRRIMLLFEASERTDKLAKRVFDGLQMQGSSAEESYEIQIHKLRGTKPLLYPALEIADFVMHAAGTAVKNSLAGKRMLNRRDFAAVFDSFPESASWFFLIDHVRYEERPAPDLE